jgi:regulatory factor X, other
MSTRSIPRPLSRASTASVHSFDQHDAGQHIPPQYQQVTQQQHPAVYQPQAHYDASYPPLEPALLQAAHHASQRDNIPLDAMHQLTRFPTDIGTQPAHPNQMHDATQQFDHTHAAQALQAALRQSQTPVPQVADTEDKKKRGSAAGGATNDKELRELLKKNNGRSLKDVAAEVIATDRTSKAEKSKQLFAMLWCVHFVRHGPSDD